MGKPSTTSPGMKTTARNLYELNVKLVDTHPPVWRRLEVAGDLPMNRLHRVLQTAFGWSDRSPHVFTVGKRRIGSPEQEADPHLLNERKLRLEELVRKPHVTFYYIYDPEREWTLELHVEQLQRSEKTSPTVRCLDGKRAAPPEALEGALAWQELLAILNDPADPDHAQRRQEVGPDFDPEAFDPEVLNREWSAMEKSPRDLP